MAGKGHLPTREFIKMDKLLLVLTHLCFHLTVPLTLSLTGVGPFGPSLPYTQIYLKVLKVRYRQNLGIPEAGSYACIEITTVHILDLTSL